MRFAVALAVALAALVPASAQSPAPPPAPPGPAPAISVSPAAEKPAWKIHEGARGKIVRLVSDRAVRWVLAEESAGDAAGPEIEPSDDGKRCAFVCNADGRFKVIAYSADGSEASRNVVAIGGGSPDPVKPDPKKPDPPKPDPAAELRAKLQAAYSADVAADRVASLKMLVELYKQAGPIADDAGVASTLALAKRLQVISSGLLKPDQLAGVRRAIATEIGAALGGTDVALTPELRKVAGELFSKIHKALGEVK